MNTELGSAYTASPPMVDPAGDPLFWQFLGEIAVQADRMLSWAVPIKAVVVREDLWPELATAYGHPVVRLAESSETMWGVLT